MSEVSRWGSPVFPVQAAGAALRARALAHGVDVRWVSPVELAAAVITADAWSALTGATSLDRPQRFGAASVQVVSAVLLRAAGCGDSPVEVSLLSCPSSHDLLALAEQHRQWADRLCPGRAGDVLAFAASDLARGDEASTFYAYASLLQMLAVSYDGASRLRAAVDAPS